MRRITVKQLANELGVEYADAAGLIRLMVAKGVAKEVGKQVNTTAQGKVCKPSTVYEIPTSYTLDLTEKQAA
jgi:hypothetical protein